MKDISAQKSYNPIQSIQRAFAFLELIAQEEQPIGVTALAKQMNLHKSTCFGILYTLVQLGYLTQDESNGKYSLGLKTFVLGRAYIANKNIQKLAGPSLSSLMEKTQETVHLVIREKNHAVYIDKVESFQAISINSRIGQRAQLHCSGVGKALLAFMSEEDIQAVMAKELQAYTCNTITDSVALRDHLEQIRQQGFSVDNEEIEIGLRCIAAPIFDAQGDAVAAISISGPSTRISVDKLATMGAMVKAESVFISNILGYK